MRTKRYKLIIFMAVLIISQSLFSESYDLVIMKTDGTVIRKAAVDIDNITFSGNPTNMVVLAKDETSTSTSNADIDSVVFQETGTVTDVDGNTYKTIRIGDLWWMAENLKTTKYRDNTDIPNVTDNTVWNGLSTGAYCYYNNNVANGETYGALYNWYAVEDARGLAPTGWRVPSDDDWKALEMHLGMSQAAADNIGPRGTDEGRKLKSTSSWSSGNGTDEVGFTGLPGGFRSTSTAYTDLNHKATFWSGSEGDSGEAWRRLLVNYNFQVNRDDIPKQAGFSVRCVKDHTT